tara:strand:+ start:422 stop:1345 length:924 start_codon:yes stop_codon:yes gene_type:complete
MKKRLPPIFEKMRFKLGKKHAPMMVMDFVTGYYSNEKIFNWLEDMWPDKGIKYLEFDVCPWDQKKLIELDITEYGQDNIFKIWSEGLTCPKGNGNFFLTSYQDAKNPELLPNSAFKNAILSADKMYPTGEMTEYLTDKFGRILKVKFTRFSENKNGFSKMCGFFDFNFKSCILENYLHECIVKFARTEDDYKKELSGLIVHCLKPLIYILRASEKQADPSVNTHDRNKASGFVRVGDTIRYDYLEDLASQSGNDALRGYVRPEVSSGIRKREHQVRGHVRIRNGRTIWVRSHKRGDAELGRVTRVIH